MLRRRSLARRTGLAVLAFSGTIGLGRGVAEAAQPETALAPLRPSGRTMTLAQAENAALAQQPQLLVARAARSTAEALRDEAQAPLLPQVTGTAQYTRATGNFVPRAGSFPGTTTLSPAPISLTKSFDYWAFGVNATQLVYDFGQTSGKARAADLNVDAQTLAERTARLQVLEAVRQAYFGARAARDLVGVAEDTFDAQQKHLEQVQGMVQVGTQPPIALAQQRAAVASARVALITAQNNYETSKSQLNQAAGIAGGTAYDVGDEELAPVEDEDQPLDVLVSRALAARPEMASFSKQREAQEASVSAARGGYGPALSAAASATEAGGELSSMAPNWSAGLLLNWPIFQGGLTQGQVREAEAGLDTVDAQRSLEELQIRLGVDTARLAVHAAKASIGAADDALVSAREQLKLAEQRYATGVGSIIELNDAQVAETTSAAEVVSARFTLSSARAQLLAALGRS
ncbi:MAG: TolC family protein [Polyangiaceae bacterium]